ncbi:MAG: hypothetical protein RLZ75_1818 [Pseudomonadota bacterium]|jgi:chemotaxis protein methyltransferase CheR
MNPFDQVVIEDFFRMLEEKTGVALDLSKSYLISSRLSIIVQQHSFINDISLLKHLVSNKISSLHWQAFDAMTTNETSFFRDSGPFDAIRESILPALIAKKSNVKALNIWSCAASSGQEAYSIAMLVRESFPELAKWKISIKATDISNTSLDKARLGIYNHLEINRGLTNAQIQRHFKKLITGKYQITNDLRRMVEFDYFNLIEDWPNSPKFDLILLRNVLIYFNEDKKCEIIKKVNSVLSDQESCLMLGSSESILFDQSFKVVQFKRVPYYKKNITFGVS